MASNVQSALASSLGADAPREINVAEFVQCRALELEMMMRAVSETVVGGNRTVMQVLPRHMRRRAANHDVRRLPLKRRLEAQKELEGQSPAKRRPPSRRHRRRPTNLLVEYARRKRRNVWLETHIWHAKRFHMTERWGYKIPEFPNDRGVRAVYRDSIKRCVLTDLSYYCCIELCGPQRHLVDRLNRLTSPDIGPTFGAKYFIDGTREGQTVIYADGAYPWSALGEVTFLWRPTTDVDPHGVVSDSLRHIWIWTHPASYDVIFTEMKNVFGLKESDAMVSEIPTAVDKFVKDCKIEALSSDSEAVDCVTDTTAAAAAQVNNGQLVGKSVKTCITTPPTSEARCDRKDIRTLGAGDLTTDSSITEMDVGVTETTGKGNAAEKSSQTNLEGSVKTESGKKRNKKNKTKANGDLHVVSKVALVRTVYDNGIVRLESLKDELCRFRLTGPAAHRIVCEALTVADVKSTAETEAKSVERNDAVGWWNEYCGMDAGKVEVLEQVTSWKEMSFLHDAGEVPPHSIHGLTVRDPRLFLPKKRTPARVNPAAISGAIEMLKYRVSSSPIWRQETRDHVKLTKMPTSQLNLHRSKCLVPGSVPDIGRQESHIPILLIQRPGIRTSFLNSTQDISSTSRLGYLGGWDLIVPAGWSMPFWISLIYRGAKAAGLREQRSLGFESGHLAFPDSCPDSPAGAEMNSSRKAELKGAYDRRPPAKRCNYVKMGMPAPFHGAWPQLIAGWSEEQREIPRGSEKCFCLRNRTLLRTLSAACEGNSRSKASHQQSTDPPASSHCHLLEKLLEKMTPAEWDACLVPVRVTLLGRGAPNQFATISVPAPGDVVEGGKGAGKKWKKARGTVDGPVEQLHHETQEKSSSHGKHKKKKGPQVSPAWATVNPFGISADISSTSLTVGTSTDHGTKDQSKSSNHPAADNSVNPQTVSTCSTKPVPSTDSLPDVTDVINVASRQTIGFVVDGGFSHGVGRGCGVGFVAARGLVKLLGQTTDSLKGSVKVLVRCTNSLQYRPATLQVVI